jgi:hypothetical protein
MIKSITSSYLAGVSDSDGSFSYNKKFSKPRNKFYYISQYQITWKYSDNSKIFFDSLVKQFGGSYFDGFTHTSYGKTRILKYCATGKACEQICKYVLPKLILKQEQAKIVLKGAKLKNNKWGTKGKPLEIWEQERSLYEEIIKLNHAKKTKNCVGY